MNDKWSSGRLEREMKSIGDVRGVRLKGSLMISKWN